MTPLDLAAVAAELRGSRLRGPLIHRSRTESTNDDVREMAEAGADEGTVVIAQEQTQGRGRRGRAWFGHPDHSLQFSILLRPALPSEQFPRLVNMVGVAMAEGCAQAAGCVVGTKWPNDLIVPGRPAASSGPGRKVGGILVEANAPRYAVAGIGLNVLSDASDFPPELANSATSLASASSACLTREAVLAAALNALDRWYGVLLQGDWDAILRRQRELESTLGHDRTVTVDGDAVTGRVLDLSPDGGLLVQTAGGVRAITVGEVL